MIAVAANATATALGGPGVLYALLGGLAIGWMINGQPVEQMLSSGVATSTRMLLRVGVVLLGARVTFSELAGLGASTVIITVGALAISLAAGLALARALKLDRNQAMILAGATSICGASAALAIAAALPKSRESDAAAAIAGVTVMGAACMLIYPLVAHLLQFDDRVSGIFLGGTLHEVVQAVGAGMAVSPEAGNAATAVKLLRVACLGPVILILTRLSSDASESRGVQLPWFVVGFLAFALLASLNLLPEALINLCVTASQWLLLIAIAALGLKSSPAQLSRIGTGPMLLLAVQTVLLGLLVAVPLALLD